MKIITLHEWFYNIICIICRDRDYLYFSFARHFNEFIKEIFEKGNVMDNGSVTIMGMKSCLLSEMHWKLEHRINFTGANIIYIRCKILNQLTEHVEEQFACSFDLSSGELLKE